MAKMHLDPSEGVLYQPDIEKEETIKGKPYKQKQREFQKTFLENIGRRNHITHHHKNGSSNFCFFLVTKIPFRLFLFLKFIVSKYFCLGSQLDQTMEKNHSLNISLDYGKL